MPPVSPDLKEQIEAAFGSVVRAGGLSLHQAAVIDQGGTPEEVERARRPDHSERWQDLPDAAVEEFHYALSYMDPEGLRFYMPRFIRYALDHPGLDDPAVDSAVYACDFGDELRDEVMVQFNAMDRTQMTAIARFLDFIAHSRDEDYDTLVAAEALAAFWYQFLEPEGW